jgi:hypothetical protein
MFGLRCGWYFSVIFSGIIPSNPLAHVGTAEKGGIMAELGEDVESGEASV